MKELSALRVCVALAIVAVTLLGVPAHAADKVKVSYPTMTSSYIFFFSAIAKGYYKDEGLDLDVVEAAGGVATPALVSGDVQFSTSGSSAISAIMKGARLKVLAVGEDRPSWQIWTTKPEIKTFHDLKGLQVGVLSRGDTGEVAIRYVLKKLGLPADFVSYTPMGSSLGTRMAVVRAGSPRRAAGLGLGVARAVWVPGAPLPLRPRPGGVPRAPARAGVAEWAARWAAVSVGRAARMGSTGGRRSWSRRTRTRRSARTRSPRRR